MMARIVIWVSVSRTARETNVSIGLMIGKNSSGLFCFTALRTTLLVSLKAENGTRPVEKKSTKLSPTGGTCDPIAMKIIDIISTQPSGSTSAQT